MLIMASLCHFKCPQLFLENYCGLSVIIYWYLMEATHPSLQGSILEGGGGVAVVDRDMPPLVPPSSPLFVSALELILSLVFELPDFEDMFSCDIFIS